MTKNYEKITAEKKWIFLSKTAIYLSLGLQKVCLSYRRSLQLSKEAIQHFKTWSLKKNSTFVGHFCPPGSGSGSTDPIESGSGSATLVGGRWDWLRYFAAQQINVLHIYQKACLTLRNLFKKLFKLFYSEIVFSHSQFTIFIKFWVVLST